MTSLDKFLTDRATLQKLGEISRCDSVTASINEVSRDIRYVFDRDTVEGLLRKRMEIASMDIDRLRDEAVVEMLRLKAELIGRAMDFEVRKKQSERTGITLDMARGEYMRRRREGGMSLIPPSGDTVEVVFDQMIESHDRARRTVDATSVRMSIGDLRLRPSSVSEYIERGIELEMEEKYGPASWKTADMPLTGGRVMEYDASSTTMMTKKEETSVSMTSAEQFDKIKNLALEINTQLGVTHMDTPQFCEMWLVTDATDGTSQTIPEGESFLLDKFVYSDRSKSFAFLMTPTDLDSKPIYVQFPTDSEDSFVDLHRDVEAILSRNEMTVPAFCAAVKDLSSRPAFVKAIKEASFNSASTAAVAVSEQRVQDREDFYASNPIHGKF